MGEKIEGTGNAERLLALHDELDALDGRERYTGLAVVLLVLAVVLLAVGLGRESVYLLMNGVVLGIGGAVVGAREVSKARRMRALGSRIGEVEEGVRGGGEEKPMLDSPG